MHLYTNTNIQYDLVPNKQTELVTLKVGVILQCAIKLYILIIASNNILISFLK